MLQKIFYAHYVFICTFYVLFFIGLQSPGKPRTVTKSNTVTTKPLTSGGSVGRRSTISYDAKAGSNEKTNLAVDVPGYVYILCMYTCSK